MRLNGKSTYTAGAIMPLFDDSVYENQPAGSWASPVPALPCQEARFLLVSLENPALNTHLQEEQDHDAPHPTRLGALDMPLFLSQPPSLSVRDGL